ncbi:Peptidase family M28 [Cnuella takakiae]|uniref:Carboxypeptidase Q n=1 Tax=Cnuella takakiae TaxID=1302690 RepID=A0A1M5A9H4_9BACT|nr:M20/M25/M40 family metallo-hydrolase [Cnuella takakiae]OLY92043.1 peptidase M28 [Cnuella takakiae]SHF26938.1 Peptidase family M28 [Cnuella takakiae]
MIQQLYTRTKKAAIGLSAVLLLHSTTQAQNKDSLFVQAVMKEVMNNSQLQPLAQELIDGIGPRLVGTPQMQKAHDWAVAKYKDWGVTARNEKWGEWRGWERGISHIDMVHPRVKSLEGMQLAWSPSTNGKTITGETILLPLLADSVAFKQWLPSVKGRFVLLSALQPSGRPDYNLEQWGLKETVDKIRNERRTAAADWAKRIGNTGLNTRTLALALESAGAAGIVQSNWSQGFGVNKIFSASTKKIPTVDIALEDYGLLYRLTESGQKPRISVRADAKELGVVPTFNTIAEIRGTEKPEEYVMLSAHFDSWDGGTGATDNGTGTITMMEAMRILKKLYPNPKRTILVGHWGSEEQGLNGSRAFVEDHPEIVNKLQALFNQDNGTGRVVNLSGQGYLYAHDYLQRWLAPAPDSVKNRIQTSFPGTPGGGGSDHASFVAAGAPAFSLSSLSWSYGNYTWHTNRDTYDKIVWDDVQNNVLLTVILAYMASEDAQTTPREKALLPVNSNGKRGEWPAQRKATRRGGLD